MSVRIASKAFAVAAFSLILGACGGGGSLTAAGGTTGTTSGTTGGGTSGGSTGGTTTGTSTGGTTGGSSGYSVTVLASSPQLASSAISPGNGVTLTIIVKDSNNVQASQAPVALSASRGDIQTQTVTNTDGSTSTQYVLTTGGDPTNGPITVTATAYGASGSVVVTETGTRVSLTGPSQVSLSQSASFTLNLLDSSGNAIANTPITAASALGNTITGAGNTNSSGQVMLTYAGTKAGSDTITVTGSGSTSTSTVTVSSASIAFTSPASNTQIPFNQNPAQSVVLHYVPPTGSSPVETLKISSNRGAINSKKISAQPVAVTTTDNGDGSGSATFTFSDDGTDGSGGATITALDSLSGLSTTLSLVVVATTPAQLTLQPSPQTIRPSSSSNITALVYDASRNPVANQRVDFSITSDPTGGSLSAGSVVTDSSGSAVVMYTAGAGNSSSTSTVAIQALVEVNSGTSPQATTSLSVSGAGLRITLGTGGAGTIVSYNNNTEYQYTYAVHVVDSAGADAPSGTQVNLQLVALAYQKGIESYVTSVGLWEPSYAVPTENVAADPTTTPPTPAQTADPDTDATAFGCKNEDQNNSGNTAGQDYNNNGSLDPGVPASVPSSVSLGSNGSTSFVITYPKDRAYWVEYELIATVNTANTAPAEAIFVLPGETQDYASQTTAPPGQISPYGRASSCADSR